MKPMHFFVFVFVFYSFFSSWHVFCRLYLAVPLFHVLLWNSRPAPSCFQSNTMEFHNLHTRNCCLFVLCSMSCAKTATCICEMFVHWLVLVSAVAFILAISSEAIICSQESHYSPLWNISDEKFEQHLCFPESSSWHACHATWGKHNGIPRLMY
jgi:hypothetical protein